MKRNLTQLTQQIYDLVIIGGGIYGACVAWDAVLRGLSVALIEKEDFGSATSANSQKIIHGGFRYLQHADFKRMRESIRERTTLMKIAPHLVHPLPVLIPTSGHGMKSKSLFSMALAIYDAVSFDRNRAMDVSKHISRGYTLSKTEVLKLLPKMPSEELTGAAVFYDAQVHNSERLTISFLRSAEKKGLHCANYVKAVSFLRKEKVIHGVEAEDVLTGEKFSIQSKMVVNTAGPWVYKVLGLLEEYRDRQKFPLVKSINLVTPLLFDRYAVGIYGKNKFYDKDALINKGSRLFFVTPWRNHSVVGTALSYYDKNPDDLKVSQEDIQEFLNDFNQACPLAQLTLKDISWIHSGFLPSSGVNPKAGNVQISKKYEILDHRTEGLHGLISTIGVKYTTARDVAEKIVDKVFEIKGQKPPKSSSSITPIYGGDIQQFNEYLQEAVRTLKVQGLDSEEVKSLIYNYGAAHSEVLKYTCIEKEDSNLLPSLSLLKAQVIHGVREEMAQKLSDIILRRTELGSAGNPGEETLNFCADVMSQELGWSLEKKQIELNEMKKIYTLF